MKKITLLLLLPLFSYSQWTQIGVDIDGEFANDQSGTSISLNADGTIVAIGAPDNTNAAGHVRIFENIGDNWVQIGNDIDGTGNAFGSGESVSLNDEGNIIAIGAPLFGVSGNPSTGHTRIFENINNEWIQLGDDIIGEATNDLSGEAVSLNSQGNIVAIGAVQNDNVNGLGAGHVRIFEFINNNWVQLGSDIDGEAQGDLSGTSIELNSQGNIIAIGAINNDGVNGLDTGHVRVFEYISGDWQQIGEDIEGEGQLDKSGNSVSLNALGNIVAIGARFNTNNNGNIAGHARVYENVSGTWTQLGVDIDGEAANDAFGFSLSLNNEGNILAASATSSDDADSNAGHVRVFKYEFGNWTQVNNTILGEAANDSFGWSVSLNNNGNIVAIGGKFNDGNGMNSGHARVYRNDLLSLEEYNAKTVSLFPNPSQGNVYLKFSELQNKISIIIYDALGKAVINKTLYNTNFVDLKTNALSNGLYLVKINIKGKNIERKLIRN